MNINVSNVKHNQFNVHNMKISETKTSIPISTAAPSKEVTTVNEKSPASSISVYDTDLVASLTISERAKEASLKFPLSNEEIGKNKIAFPNEPQKFPFEGMFNKEVDDGALLVEDPEVEVKRLIRELYPEYHGIISGEKIYLYGDLDLDGIFRNALKLYEEIENGPDDEQTKVIKRAAFEEALKDNVGHLISTVTGYQCFIEDAPNMEQNPTIRRKIGAFNTKQNIAIANSMQKLVVNFFNYLKNSKTYDYASMLEYVNKDSTNTRDINHLNLSEISGYISYAENSKYRFSFSNSDIDFFKGYFSTFSNQDSFLSDAEWWKNNSILS